MSSSRGSEHHVRAVGVEQMRTERKMTYRCLEEREGVRGIYSSLVTSAPSLLPMVKETARQIIGTQSFPSIYGRHSMSS